MTDLMEEARKAAMAAYIAYVDEHGLDIAKDLTEAELLEVCARAILAAEQRGREEAAKIVEAVGSDHDPQLADFLAAAIRRGTP